jgi:hypothetical protein
MMTHTYSNIEGLQMMANTYSNDDLYAITQLARLKFLGKNADAFMCEEDKSKAEEILVKYPDLDIHLSVGLVNLTTKIETYHTGFFDFKTKDNYGGIGFMHEDSKIYILPIYSGQRNDFCNGLIAMRNLDNLYGFVDKYGVIAVPFQYEDAESFVKVGSEYLAAVKKEGKWGLIDKNNMPLGKGFIYEYAGYFKNNCALVRLEGGKYSFVDKKGELISKSYYDNAWPFDDMVRGYAKVKLENKIGLIDNKGNLLGGLMYDSVEISDCGKFIIVKLDNKVGYMNHKGQLLGGKWFDSLSKKSKYDEHIIACFEGKWGLIIKENENHGFIYDSMELLWGRAVIVGLNGKGGLLDLQGNVIDRGIVYDEIKICPGDLLKGIIKSDESQISERNPMGYKECYLRVPHVKF